MSKRRSVIWALGKNKLEEIVKSAKTISDILKHFNLLNKGYNYKSLKERLKEDNIDFSHLRVDGTNSIVPTKRPIETYLIENSKHNNNTGLKKRLLKEGLLKNQCYICGQLPEWQGKPLTLQLDHINGISNDNRIENLRILCPHCHSQTDTFAGRNKKYVVDGVEYLAGNLPRDPSPSELNPDWRNEPRPNTRKVERPSKEELEKLVWEKPTTELAKEFGVSDKAISKWCLSYGITKPGRGYWAKKKAA